MRNSELLPGGPPGRLAAAAPTVRRARTGLYRRWPNTRRREVLLARRKSMRAAFARAQSRGGARDDLDIEVIPDMLTAPFYSRVLFGHAPLRPSMAREVVDYVLRITAPGRRGSS